MPPRLSAVVFLCEIQPATKITLPQAQWFAWTSVDRLSDKKPDSISNASATAPPKNFLDSHPLKDAPRQYGEKVREFTPKPLLRPIGMSNPPVPGQLTDILDARTWKEKHDQAAYQKLKMEQRLYLTKELLRPYFRDYSNLKHHDGKIWIAPPRPYRQEYSLFFPNLVGTTLAKTDAKLRDTTPVLKGRVSVTAIYSSMWAENQVNSFIGETQNPRLHEVLRESSSSAQIVRINVEENFMKAWIIGLFKGSLRRQVSEASWDKYFVVRRGITDEIRESMGLLNSKVGYTYLVDRQCKIRWAGSATAHEEEKDSLVKSAKILLRETDRPSK